MVSERSKVKAVEEVFVNKRCFREYRSTVNKHTENNTISKRRKI